MRRCAALALTILATSTLLAGLLAVSASPAAASGLAAQLHDARHRLTQARLDLAAARTLATAFATEGSRGVDPTFAGDQYARAVLKAKARVQSLRRLVAKLAAELSQQHAIAVASATGNWLPVVRQVAAREHISASGLYRLMSLESGGRATASSGPYHGLYQYATSTWQGAWNPWRGRSIYDGVAQIQATARAIKRGWGPRMWPNTYPRAF